MKSFYLFSILFILSISLFAQIPLPEAVTYYEVQNNGFWEDPTIWNTGSLPPDDAVVVIPAGKEVKITSKLSARHKFIQIDGYLSVARNEDTQILVETIQISNTGYFRIGTPTNGVLENNTAEIVFINDGNAIDRTWDTQQLSRGLVSLGKVEVFGAEKKHFIVFNADLFKDSNQIELANGVPSNWKIGDKIVIPGTIFERNVAFQDEKLTIANIEGQTITLVETLQFDHIRVRDDMPLHLANLTRNVIFRSEATEIPLRGHTMFMNNDNFAVNTVQIENAAFIDLGRTDKSIPLDEIIVDIPSATINPGPSNNKRGRYAVHFHKNGYGADVNTPPSSVEGCVVESTAGWGFVNHSSHVDIRKNVCYDFVGAAFVTESGDELGNFIENIAIKGTGNGEYRPTRLVFFNEERPQPLSDFGFSGDGFWFQGPAIRAINNVAANCNGAGMIWFTIGSIEIENNKMIGMDSSIVRQAYADYPNIATLNERRWKHATNEVFLADLPILQCDNFQAYACFKGFRIRFNNTDTTPFFSTDFGATDIWEYKKTILPAKGYEPNKQIANRLRQYVSNINVWNNEEGFTVRYSSNSTVSNVNIINKIRAYDIYLPFAGLSCFHTTRLYDFNNLHIENYPIGAFVVEKNEDINNPAATISNNTLTNVANNFYNLKNAFCSKAQNIFSKNINPNTTEIHFDRDIANNIAILRYKQENEMYWNYLTATQANIITLNNLQTATTYQYQILLGNAHKTSLWSDEHHFTTTCQIFNCAYAIQNNVVLNECIISTCINDVVKLSLNTTNGTSIWTGPNNYSAVGNINNTVNIGAITPFSYGIYTATFTDNQGCISNKQIEIVPQNTLNMSYSVNDGQTVANKIIQACLNDKISLSCYTTNGTSIWLTPSGNILHGNELNTIKIESMTENDYGTYYVKHTNDDGCGATYNMTIISNAQTDIAYSINQADFKYSNTNIISTNIGNSIQISLMGNISNAIWQGTTSNFNTIGSTNKSITIDYINEEHFGTYQVHFIDNNGCQAKQNIAIVSNNSIVQKNNEIPNKSYQQIKISPNPISSNQKLNLAFYTETESEKHFSIFDIHGKLQQQQKFLLQKGINELQIDITHLSKGVFIIADKQGNKTKFIVL